jgi:MFS family permease
MRTFLLVWLGQVISLWGSKLTEFALGVWVYQQTGSITQFSFTLLFIYLPNVLISPFAGVLVDRWNRRWAMAIGDFIAGCTTLVVMFLLAFGQLEVWHIYLAVAVMSIFEAFKLPAYTAAIAQLVPRQQQSRANGMVQISKAAAKIIAPIAAGILIKLIDLKGVLLVDCTSYILAIATLSMVRFPNLKIAKVKRLKLARFWYEINSASYYIAKRPGLFWLLLFIGTTNFTMGVLEVVFWPFVLNMSSTSELGRVLSLGGCGMLIGSLLMSVWGGPKHHIYGILALVPLQGLFIILGGLKASVIFSAVAIFGYLFAQPIIVSCNQSIWQSKVPIDLQGRVFALQQMLERSLAICAYLITGPLIDYALEPLLANHGFHKLIDNSIGQFFQLETGQEIALLMILVGIINIVAALVAYREPRLRYVEKELPDAIEFRQGLGVRG